MCINCTCFGIVLAYITVKSGSLWPAAIMHAVNNTNPSILALFADGEKVKEIMDHSILGFVILEIPMVILGVVCYRIWVKEQGNKSTISI